jgi:tetrahydromethanopterin S-methyltransferase subunit G
MAAPLSYGHRSTSPRAAVIAVLLVVLALAAALAGCGSAASQAGASAGPADPNPAKEGTDGGGTTTGGQGDVPLADLAERKIVKTGEITIEVPGIGAAIGDVRATAVALGGYVSGSRAGGEHETATLTLRVPADRFDEALQRLHGLEGEVRVEATNEEDVTSSVVDLEARIRNLEASEEQYRVLIGRAEKVDDILAVQSRLDDVRGQIEQLSAQLKQLNGLAALSTLTVTLVPADHPVEDAAAGWDPGATLGTATAALVSAGQGIADIAIWLLVVGLPILVLVGILFLLGRRLAPVLRRRVPSATGGGPPLDG